MAFESSSASLDSYHNAHSEYHPIFNVFLEKYGLEDIFMISSKGGDIFYSSAKEYDYATNVINGPYSKSGLADVFRKAKQLKAGEVAFDDFSPYEPSRNVPAAFIGSPVYHENNIIGVLAFQVPTVMINNVMGFGGRYKEAGGLGDSGEVYLVGEDKLMRSDSRFIDDIENEHVELMKTTIGGVHKIDTIATSKALAGDSGAELIVDYRGGEKVLSAYEHLDFF